MCRFAGICYILAALILPLQDFTAMVLLSLGVILWKIETLDFLKLGDEKMEENKIYYYSFGYGSEEDSGYATLMHEKLYSEEEYYDMIYEASIEAAMDYYKKQQALYAEFREDKEDVLDTDCWEDCTITIDYYEIYERTVDKLCELFGFVQPTYVRGWSAYGWGNLRSKEDQGRNDKLQDRISDAVIKRIGESIEPWKFIKLNKEHK